MRTEVRHKEFRFPVEVVWDEGRRTTARVDGKAPLQIATPRSSAAPIPTSGVPKTRSWPRPRRVWR
jgi:hypothetical protein